MQRRRPGLNCCFITGILFGFFLFVCPPIYPIDARTDLPRIQADAQRGVIEQEIRLGAAYFTGRGVPQNLELAAHWYERAANAGDPLAQNQIGYFYQVGIGVPRDSARAAQWYQRSAANGFLKAKVNLAIAYLWGIGVRKDENMAFEQLRDAAAKKSGLADAYLGDMYYFGIGVTADPKEARNCYEKGAHLKDSFAEFRYATLLSMGNAPDADLIKAAKLFREAAKDGLVPAQFALGLLLVNHPELPAQEGEAIYNLQNSSDAGIWKSSVILGVLYRDGRGVDRNPSRAYYYFQLAQLQGGEIARTKTANDVAILSRKLTDETAQHLALEAGEWFRRHPLPLNYVSNSNASLNDFPTYAISAANDIVHAGSLLPNPPERSRP